MSKKEKKESTKILKTTVKCPLGVGEIQLTTKGFQINGEQIETIMNAIVCDSLGLTWSAVNVKHTEDEKCEVFKPKKLDEQTVTGVVAYTPQREPQPVPGEDFEVCEEEEEQPDDSQDTEQGEDTFGPKDLPEPEPESGESELPFEEDKTQTELPFEEE